jgi:hypothetical protein
MFQRSRRDFLEDSIFATAAALAAGSARQLFADEEAAGNPTLKKEKVPVDVQVPSLPDDNLVTTYRHAATKNVLAALNPEVFPGYFNVCAGEKGYGSIYPTTFPSLDGHQMTDALLWLGEVEVAKLNWDYVRSFQRPNGCLPLAILPALAGKPAGPEGSKVFIDANGGLYEHPTPGNPLAALAGPTYIQNADVIYRHTLDRRWLKAQIGSVNLAADYLISLTTPAGVVGGAGYYVEYPSRIDSDGVSQCHAVDALRRVATLNRVLEDEKAAAGYEQIADRIASHFTTKFWADTHFAEYLHPVRGFISSHGLTDVDWAALATGVALPQQQTVLWPQLREETAFYYGGMPTGISTRPETYEDWEFSPPSNRRDLAAMGRVWYIESWARSRFRDAEGLLDGLRRVGDEGRKHDYSWRERYLPSSTDSTVPLGAERYCEYPANFIRIVNRFLLGIDLRLDGSILLAPNVTPAFWDRGFGHVLRVRGTSIEFQLHRDSIDVTYSGPAAQRLGLRPPARDDAARWKVTSQGTPCQISEKEGIVWLTLPSTKDAAPRHFRIERDAG